MCTYDDLAPKIVSNTNNCKTLHVTNHPIRLVYPSRLFVHARLHVVFAQPQRFASPGRRRHRAAVSYAGGDCFTGPPGLAVEKLEQHDAYIERYPRDLSGVCHGVVPATIPIKRNELTGLSPERVEISQPRRRLRHQRVASAHGCEGHPHVHLPRLVVVRLQSIGVGNTLRGTTRRAVVCAPRFLPVPGTQEGKRLVISLCAFLCPVWYVCRVRCFECRAIPKRFVFSHVNNSGGHALCLSYRARVRYMDREPHQVYPKGRPPLVGDASHTKRGTHLGFDKRMKRRLKLGRLSQRILQRCQERVVSGADGGERTRGGGCVETLQSTVVAAATRCAAVGTTRDDGGGGGFVHLRGHHAGVPQRPHRHANEAVCWLVECDDALRPLRLRELGTHGQWFSLTLLCPSPARPRGCVPPGERKSGRVKK